VLCVCEAQFRAIGPALLRSVLWARYARCKYERMSIHSMCLRARFARTLPSRLPYGWPSYL